MSKLRIDGNVKIGHIYECDFGLYKKCDSDPLSTTTKKLEATHDNLNYRVPVEIIKKRPVVVIGKHRGQYIVVPISKTEETANKEHKKPENTGIHIKLTEDDMPETPRYQGNTVRWAKSNLVTTIDGGRLRDLYNSETQKHIPAHKMSDESLSLIRKGVIISIGFREILAS